MSSVSLAPYRCPQRLWVTAIFIVTSSWFQASARQVTSRHSTEEIAIGFEASRPNSKRCLPRHEHPPGGGKQQRQACSTSKFYRRHPAEQSG